MADPIGEVRVQTIKNFSHIAINGGETVADVVREAGEDPTKCTIRMDGALVTDQNTPVAVGATLTAFKTQTVAEQGVKGAEVATNGGTETPPPNGQDADDKAAAEQDDDEDDDEEEAAGE